jgi:drug/metabolite transporter (DMT)-like permease
VTRSNLVSGLAWVGLSILCWAPMFSIGKRTLPHLDPLALNTARYVISVAVLVALLWAVEGRAALRFGERLGAATVFGLIGITGFNLFIWTGLIYTRPEHASVILALQTPLTALAVWLTRGQRPASFTLGCVLAAFAGVVLVVTRGDPAGALHGGELGGDALILLGGVSWVIYTLAAGRFAGWSPLRLTVLTCIPGFVGLIVAHAVAISVGAVPVPTLGAVGNVAWELVYFSLGTVVLGVLGFNNAARRLGPLNTMLMLNTVPVLVFAIEAWLGRTFAPVELAGAGLVVGALIANNLYLRGVSIRR